MRSYQVVICFFAFTVTALFYVWNALPYPMVYDDLHLIRSFALEDVSHSFYGPFDADNIETIGLRPMTLLFNYARYELFGENVVAHRLFLVILFAIFFTTVLVISSMLGTLAWKWAMLAGILCIGAKYNVNHYVWLADGIHLLQGVLFGFSLLLLLVALKKNNFWFYAGSLCLVGINLLVREDTLATIPAFIFLGGYFIYTFKSQSKKGFFAYCLALCVICVVFLQYRAQVLPQSKSILGNPFGFFDHLMYMWALPGLSYFNRISMFFVYAWQAVLIGIFILFFSKTRNSETWRSGIWLACGILACLPGITTTRVNLLLFPTMFFTIFLCSILQSFSVRSQMTKIISIGIIVLGICSEMYITPIITQNFHPFSSTAMVWNIEYIYGTVSPRATIPAQRRAEITQNLSKVGINTYGNYVWFKRKIKSTEEKGQRVPDGEKLFVPYLAALTP